ncbi:DnaJ family molecular chaperone [Geobacter sp.]|uniref:J domain-containing protein n=1 Tax=Geobacter sp. TaxID=46610 RepID=UPI0027B9B010|nr:J domain-containing protein [Geobacter sp.]
MSDMHHYFDLLQLKPDATPAEVKRAFRDQVSAWHPDRFSADPAMQRRAEERLRLVIEAHRSIVAYHASLASGDLTGQPSVQGGDRCGLPRTAVSFFRSVPNLVFCAVVLVCALLASARFGVTIRAWTYGAEMALVPALFSLAYNLTACRSPAVRNLYLGFSLCALAVVVVDGAMTGVQRTAPVGVQGAFPPGGYDGGAVGGVWSLTQADGVDRVSDGLPSVLREQPAPRVPAVPLAPVAPAAPQAPAAPVVSPAR